MNLSAILKSVFVIICLLFLAITTNAETTTAIISGPWLSPTTWSNGVPQNTDVVIIPSGIIVNVAGVNGTEYEDFIVQVDGELNLDNGQKLRIDCNSLADIRATGVLSGDNGGSKLDVCGDEVFRGGGAPLNGPASFGRNPLPIELINFNSTIITTGIALNWQTATETNNDFFTIEKSVDGIRYETVKTIDGAGNSSSVLSYSTIDSKPTEGIAYYRLKQTDFDGKYAHSSVIAVEYKKTFSANDISIYPNPCSICNINVANSAANDIENMMIEIYDVTGKKVFSETIDKNQFGSFSFNAKEHLNNGVYFLKIEQQDIVKKIIVQ